MQITIDVSDFTRKAAELRGFGSQVRFATARALTQTAVAGRDAIRAGMAGEPRFFAEENGHQLGTPATIEPTPNSHVFSERELDNMGRRR